MKKIIFDAWGFFLHKSSVLLILFAIFFRSFKSQIDSCFFTIGFSFQKIAGLEILIRLSIWSLNDLKKIVSDINNTELLCKKNPQISNSIFFNFFSEICKKANNFS